MRRYKTLIAIAILLRFVVQEFVQEWVQSAFVFQIAI